MSCYPKKGSDGRVCLKGRRPRFDPWVGKNPRRREWVLAPVFLPGEFLDRGAWRAAVYGVTKSDSDQRLRFFHTLKSSLCHIMKMTSIKVKKRRFLKNKTVELKEEGGARREPRLV